MADKRTDIIFRFGLVYAVFVVLFALVIVKAAKVMTVERNGWLELHAKTSGEKQDVVEPPKRGNIYACDGRLMASSVPTYRVYMDMRVEYLKENPDVFYDNVDSVALCLSRMFRDRPASAYKSALVAAFKRKTGRFAVYPKRIPYYQWKEMQTFPLYRLGRYKSGLFADEYVQRVKPFGSLASRTVGDVYADLTKGGSSGVEYSFNRVLTGKPGLSTVQKVANRYERVVVQEPEDGMDVVTTLDIDMQDISEHALLDVLRRYNARSGYAVFMEVETGEVKSIVNMYRGSEPGVYYEKENGALSDMMEPGSTFKTLVLMAALDEGRVSLDDTVDVGNGRLKYHPRAPEVTDHNARKGGYGRISVANVIHGSSNIGMHKIVYDAYGNSRKSQAELVDKLHDMKVGVPMDLDIKGAAKPKIKHPVEDKSWSTVTSLSAISRGYEIVMPPIYTLAYYNAIANDGKLIRPFFVKSVSKDGQPVKTFSENILHRDHQPRHLQALHPQSHAAGAVGGGGRRHGHRPPREVRLHAHSGQDRHRPHGRRAHGAIPVGASPGVVLRLFPCRPPALHGHRGGERPRRALGRADQRGGVQKHRRAHHGPESGNHAARGGRRHAADAWRGGDAAQQERLLRGVADGDARRAPAPCGRIGGMGGGSRRGEPHAGGRRGCGRRHHPRRARHGSERRGLFTGKAGVGRSDTRPRQGGHPKRAARHARDPGTEDNAGAEVRLRVARSEKRIGGLHPFMAVIGDKLVTRNL